MKILQIINSLYRSGGAEKFVTDLAIAQAQLPDIEVEVLNIIKPYNEDYTDLLHNYGIKTYVLSKSLYSPLNVIRLARFIRKKHFDIIHVHLFPSLYWTALATQISSNSPKLIYTEHSTKNKRRGKFLFRILDSFIYKQYHSICAISTAVRSQLQKQIGSSSNISIIPNGINVKAIQNTTPGHIREELSLPPNSILLAMVARFVSGKDYHTLFRAMPFLPENAYLVCLGDGPMLKECITYIHARHLQSRVYFLGVRSDVIEILRNTDIIILSTEHEGFSISMLEAMACKKPFIASAVPGITDLVDNIALLFRFQDEQDLASKINALITDNKLYQVTANKCYKFSLSYDIHTTANAYLQLYLS